LDWKLFVTASATKISCGDPSRVAIGFHIPTAESDPVFWDEQYCWERAEAVLAVVARRTVKKFRSDHVPPKQSFVNVIVVGSRGDK